MERKNFKPWGNKLIEPYLSPLSAVILEEIHKGPNSIFHSYLETFPDNLDHFPIFFNDDEK